MRTMLLTLTLLVAPTIVAADTPDVHKMASDDCARARKANKTCVLTIDNEIIDGDKPVSTESQISVTTFITHASLITIRRDFIPEILKTAEDL
ncbi:MAG: hypothetical protein M4D80_29240 [Myxococcota bacterium]|nr:hypothetical protein [Myxococcota bacterium]